MNLIASFCILLTAISSVEAGGRTKVSHPAEAVNPPWMEQRMKLQLKMVDRFRAFVDFEFSDRLPQSGITFSHISTDDTGLRYKPSHYDHGNSVAVADVDGDGLLDLYFVNQAGDNELWRNRGEGTFAEMTATAGVSVPGAIGVAASFADIDNDGDPDLFVTTIREGNQLFENDGSGRFTEVTAAAGVGGGGHSSAAVFFDYDRDGLLDLFVCNVGVYTKDNKLTGSTDAMHPEKGEPYSYWEAYSDAFAGHLKPERTERSILYRNLGNRRFADVTTETGLVDTSWSGAASPIDANGDGWTDLYILNMQGHDEYFENDGGVRFIRKSRDVFPRTPWGAMSAKVFDYDNDGHLDLYVSDMHSDMSEDVGPFDEKLKSSMKFPPDFLRDGGMSIFGNAFYRNNGDGSYTEISDEIGAENYWPWGLSVGDVNADGFEDVFLASSMNYPFRYGVNSLLVNDLGTEFLDAEYVLGVEPRRDNATAKPWFYVDCDQPENAENTHCKELTGELDVWAALGSRSSAIFDLDGDGDLDIVTNEFNAEPMVLVSDLSERKQVTYLEVKLTGETSNRSGIGAIVEVEAGTQSYKKVNDGQSGYLSQSDMPLYFGLGDAEKVDRIVVSWPSGTTQTLSGPIESNQLIEIAEE